MLVKTRGIVFKYFKYSDTSLIVKIFTEQLGIRTYIVNGVRNKRAKFKIALFQPLTTLELIVYDKPGAEINRIAEIKCPDPLVSLPYEFTKTAIGMFISEVLYKSIKEESGSPELFDFIVTSIHVLDQMESGIANFHLQFSIKLLRYIGYSVEESAHFFSGYATNMADIKALIENNYDEPLKMNNQQRTETLSHILEFYRQNIDSFGDVKSLKVLKEIM